MPPTARHFLTAAGLALLIGGAAAQDLDQGKSSAKLFADNCAACHHRARGLAKGRFSLTLFLFLQKHYTSTSGSAWALASYLESLDTPKRASLRGVSQSAVMHGARTPSRPTSSSVPRPPAPVPGH